jgi:hypothetical protein
MSWLWWSCSIASVTGVSKVFRGQSESGSYNSLRNGRGDDSRRGGDRFGDRLGGGSEGTISRLAADQRADQDYKQFKKVCASLKRHLSTTFVGSSWYGGKVS